MKKVLISGFDAFGDNEINPSVEIIKKLPKEIGDFSIYTLEIPTKAKESVMLLKAKVESLNPDFVINIGLAKGRKAISIERIAINIDDFRIPDNDKYQPIDKKIQEEGEDGYFSNLPLKAIIHAVRTSGHEIVLSNSAGTYVCNHVMYEMQYLAHTKYPHMKTGFIHVPEISEVLSIEKMVEILICVISHLEDQEIEMKEGCLW